MSTQKSIPYDLIPLPVTVNALSMFTSLCVAISYLFISRYRPGLADRISLRLIFLANAASFSFSIWLIAFLTVPSENDSFCIAASTMIIFSDTAIAISIMLVGFNLFFLVVLGSSKYSGHERIYFVVIFSVSTANGLIVFMYSMIQQPLQHGVDNGDPCWLDVHDDLKRSKSFVWRYYYYWRASVFILCAILFFGTIIALRAKRDWFMNMILQQNVKTTSQEATQAQNLMTAYQETESNQPLRSSIHRKVALRCVLYVLVLLITRVFGVVLITETRALNDETDRYLMATFALGGTQGIFIGLIYFSDPAIMAAAKDLKNHWKKNRSDQINDQEMTDVDTIISEEPCMPPNSSKIDCT